MTSNSIQLTQPLMIHSYRTAFVISLVLTLAAVVVFWQVPGNDFVAIDDNVYVTDNSFVASGLNRDSVKWAFTTVRAEFWHPLTWLSLMADTQLFGTSPRGYHLTNLGLHIINTLLLFFFLAKATSKTWQSGFAAALFALHPLHVESVAWIAQRKDVLSTFFWLLTLWCYARYIEKPNRLRFGWTFVFFILGLMSKPMLITLPFTLLLLDYWPFRRFQFRGSWRLLTRDMWPYVYEKLPLIGITAVAVFVTYMAQKYGGGLNAVNPSSLFVKIGNALISYVLYVWKMVWPLNLAFFYPFPSSLPVWQMMIAALVIGLITLVAIKCRKGHPYLLVGWLWYLGTLVPVIGLVKIGDFAMADRYTYVPLIGLFIAISWGIPDLLKSWRARLPVLVLLCLVVLSALALLTRAQIRSWSNSRSLYEHALRVTPNNFMAHYGLGDILASEGKFEEAISHFSKAVRIRPEKATLQNTIGRALASQGAYDEALPHLVTALKIKPQFAEAHFNIAIALIAKQRNAEAIEHLSAALNQHITVNPIQGVLFNDGAIPYIERGNAYKSAGNIDNAIEQYSQALSISQQHLPTLIKLATLYAAKSDYPKALSLYQIETSVEGLRQALLSGYQNWRLLHPPINQ